MVTEGVTVHVELFVPAQVPPLHSNEVAAGLQFAVNVDDAPAEIIAGFALNVHCGGDAFAP